MKQLVIAIQEFNQTKREETANTINMHLQSLSIFNPHNNMVSQFFVCLYELMGKMEQRSPFAWKCVDVLSNACRNPSARHALIHTYQFIPSTRTLKLEFSLAPRPGTDRSRKHQLNSRPAERYDDEGTVGFDMEPGGPGGGMRQQVHSLTSEDFPALEGSRITVQSRPNATVNFMSKINTFSRDDFPTLGGSRASAVTITTNSSSSRKKAPEVTITRTLRPGGGSAQNLSKSSENFPRLGPPTSSSSGAVHLSVNTAPKVFIHVNHNSGVTTTHLTSTSSSASAAPSNRFNVNQKPMEAFPVLGGVALPLNPKQVYMVLAQSLFDSSAEVKTIVLDMFENPDFSRKMIAEAMSTIQPFVAFSEPGKSNSFPDLATVNFPVLSLTQLQRIDEVLVKIERVFADKQETSILTSDVIELYEYKLTAKGNAERATMSSLEAASDRCTHLQHRDALLTTELKRLYQLLYHVQQCYEKTTNLNHKLQQSVDSLKVQVEGDTGKLKAFKSQIESNKRQLSEAKENLERITKKYDELSESKSQLDEQHAKAKQVMAKLKENSLRLEKNVQKKEDAIKKYNNMIDGLDEKKTELEENLAQRDAYLQQELSELKDARRRKLF